MSTYELDDDLVRRLVSARSGLGPDTASHELALALEDQLPIPEPTKFGAVVVNEHGANMVLANPGAGAPWWNNARKVWSEIPGRIVEILSEGVDL